MAMKFRCLGRYGAMVGFFKYFDSLEGFNNNSWLVRYDASVAWKV